MALNIDIGYASLTGNKEQNEDFCAAMQPDPGSRALGVIAALADGVSTGGMGREAAQTTVTSLVRDYHGTPPNWDTTVALDRIIGAQNSWLAGVNRRRQPALGLTTLTAMVLRGETWTLAHVGDTRAYLWRGGALEQISTDHVAAHPELRHQLLRCVGAEERLVVDYQQGDLQLHDSFLLLSDGVHGVLCQHGAHSDKALQRVLELRPKATAQALADALVRAAQDAGTHDDATALVIRVEGLEGGTLDDEARRAEGLPSPHKLKVGERIDGLQVTALVADNGINVLYQVRDPATQALYALKALHPARAHDPQERAMLAHEGWLARGLSVEGSPHFVRLRDRHPQGIEPGFYYLLYDWHGGETLQQWLQKETPLVVEQSIQMAIQALKAVGRLHRQGVVHRDVKPANLHLGQDGMLRLLDLGAAISGHEPAVMKDLHAGTPSYMNPEQWGEPGTPGAQASGHSDLFAVGVTLYQLLTGKLPYGEVLPYQSGRYHRDPRPPSRHNPAVPIWLDHVALKAVARDAKQRFETAEEFLLALERGASRPVTPPPPSPLAERDPAFVWKLAAGISLLFNALLIYWLLFLPK